MPSAITTEAPTLPQWERPEKTAEKLAWADIKIIDMSIYDTPGGKQKLAADLRDAVRLSGIPFQLVYLEFISSGLI